MDKEFEFIDFGLHTFGAVEEGVYAFSTALPPTSSLLFSDDNSFADSLLSSPLGLDFDTPFTTAYSTFSPSSERSYSGLGTPELTELPPLFGDNFQIPQWTDCLGLLPQLPPLEDSEQLIDVKLEAGVSPALTRLPSIEAEDHFQKDEDAIVEEKPRNSTRREKGDCKFTGTRNSKLPHIPIDAPTMSRSYIIPSSTSRKRSAPVAASRPAKKSARARCASPSPTAQYENPEEPYDPATLPTAVLSAIEVKRRSNTLAARLSRNRKAEHLRELMEELEAVKRERDEWMEKAAEFERELLTLRVV